MPFSLTSLSHWASVPRAAGAGQPPGAHAPPAGAEATMLDCVRLSLLSLAPSTTSKTQTRSMFPECAGSGFGQQQPPRVCTRC